MPMQSSSRADGALLSTAPQTPLGNSLLLPSPPPFFAVLPAAGRLRAVLPLAAVLAELSGPRLSRWLPWEASCSGGGRRIRPPFDSSVHCWAWGRSRHTVVT